MDDTALLKLLKDNPERGLQTIIQIYGPAVHKICSFCMSGYQQQDIEEAESDVYVKLWKHRESVIINENYSLKSYLFAIARNTCIDRQCTARSPLFGSCFGKRLRACRLRTNGRQSRCRLVE